MSHAKLKERNQATYPGESQRLTTVNPRGWRLPVLFSSSALFAFLLFAAVDLCLRFSFHPDVYQLPIHNFIWWSVSDYRKLNQTPETLIFGSSLMLAVTDYGDATYLNRTIDSATHHQSICLANSLDKLTGGQHSNFSFAVGGQMASDVYAIARTLINPMCPPKLIIWGIAPRDFVDTAFREPIVSSTAQYMNKISGNNIIAEQHTSLPYYIEQTLRQISKLFSSKEDFISPQMTAARTLVNDLTKGLDIPSDKNTPRHYGAAAEENLEIGDRLVPPCKAAPERLVDNTTEYRARYNPFKPQSFALQLKYCDNFLSYADKLRIKVLFVNMPITSTNMALMPEGVYKLYLNNIKQLAQNHAATFYDFNKESLFSEKDFVDSVHLNGIGGKHFVEILAHRIASDHILK
jgi:hypothetical protein